jgi:hypothetical protein
MGTHAYQHHREEARRRAGVSGKLTMATRTRIDDLALEAKDWIERAADEHLRRHGRFRDLVLRMLAPDDEVQPEVNGVWETRVIRTKRRVTEPSCEDIIAAYEESSDPLPAPIVAYIVKHFVKGLPRKTGPKLRVRSTWDDVMIIAFYQHQLHKAKLRVIEKPATRAKERTAKKFHLSVRALETLIAERPLLKSS